jgi:hypothetical protein
MSKIFRNEALLARLRAGRGSELLVVSFANWSASPGLRKPGFGEEFCKKYGFDAVHVTAARNHWFQDPGFEPMLQAIAAAAVGYRRVVTYGASMGGYAAIRAAGALGAQRCVAVSPQYSVDPARAPWETRWAADRAAIRFDEAELERAPGVEYLIAYDPWEPLDRRQVDEIMRRVPVTPFRLPFAGHATLRFLEESGLASAVMRGLLAGEAAPQDFRGEVRARRRGTAVYWRSLSEEARLSDAARDAVLSRAVELAPDDLAMTVRLAAHRLKTGDLEGARDTAARGLARKPDNVHLLYQLGKIATREGEWDQAEALGRRILELEPGHADAQRLIDHADQRRAVRQARSG